MIRLEFNSHSNPDPRKNDPTRISPNTNDPSKVDPTRIAPGINEPGKVDPTRIAPDRNDPGQPSQPSQPSGPPVTPAPVTPSPQSGGIKYYSLLLLMLAFFSMSQPAISSPSSQNSTLISAEEKSKQKAEAFALLSRLNDIKDLDKSKLSGEQKADLKKEVRDIKKRMAEINGGIYLSAGAILLIILLIIIL